MKTPRRAHGFRLSFQAKVLVAVLVVLVPLPILTVWIVSDRMYVQMMDEARKTLGSAEDAFLKSMGTRSRDLAARYELVAGEARVTVTVQLANVPKDAANARDEKRTMERLLGDLLGEAGGDVELFFFSNLAGQPMARASRATDSHADPQAFEKATADITHVALMGEHSTGSLTLDGRAYTVVSVPVFEGVTMNESGQKAADTSRGPQVGALTAVIRITDETMLNLSSPRTEILLLSDRHVLASSVKDPERHRDLLQQISLPASSDATAMEVRNIQPVKLNGEHYLALTGTYDAARPHQGFHYLLLSSYELRLSALKETLRILAELSFVGILLGAAVVWFFLRRITQPLRELRDLAEAVGRGDFSRKVERFSNDECGDLAEEFNRMTSNLQSSHRELEKAVDTLKTTQAQLIQSEKLSAVGQFVAGVAHELNNPLTAVIGFSDLLSSVETNEKSRKHLDLIAKSAHRCHKIVQSLLSFARQHSPERRLVEVNHVIDEVLEIMAYDLRTSNITIEKEFSTQLPGIMADAHQLQQVFVNILGNARQAIEAFRRDGRIVIRTRSVASVVRIEFQDNGPGIRPDNLSRIFDPFFTTKAVGKGTGLGLSLSYGIIQEHGGSIRAESEVGRGATFIIELPAAESAPTIRSAAPFVPAIKPDSGKGLSVLVIDDEEWILQLTEELLRGEGYEVISMSSGERAIELLSKRKFDVIVSDWKMPGLNGIEMYQRIRAVDAEAAERMLFMTGDIINDVFQEFLQKHAKTCLPKPFAIEDFRKAVASVAHMRGEKK